MPETNKKKTALVKTQDGFKNILKGLEGTKDPHNYTQYTQGLRITQQLASDLYTYNWLCGKAVDAPIDDAVKNWRSLLISDPAKKEEAELAMKGFEVKDKVSTALKWARAYGGAVIIPIIDNENQAEPLDPAKISKDSLRNLVVLDRYNVYPDVINRNILSANFGKPEFYTVVRNGQLIHHTRVIRFDGVVSTLRELEIENYWGKSIFTRIYEPIRDAGVVSQSIADLIYESNVDVYKIKGLNEAIVHNNDALVKNRLQIAHSMKSFLNAIALDTDDDYDKKSNTFANLPDIDDRFVYKVSGATGIPVTRLIGREPAGLNATGESDENTYNDMLKGIQENDIRPALDRLDPIVMASEFGKYDEFEYIFNPIKIMTEKEQSEIDQKRAQTDAVYLAESVILESDVKAQLAERGTYITIDEERVKADAAADDLDFEEEDE